MGKIIFSEDAYRYSGAAVSANTNAVLAVAAKCSADIEDNNNWGYSELVAKVSADGGENWSEEKVVIAPPARKVTAEKGNTKAAFFTKPVLTTATDGTFVLVFTFYPESKGSDDKKLLDKKKTPFSSFNGKNYPVIYDRDGKFYLIVEGGRVLDMAKAATPYIVKGLGDLYNGEEFLGNIYLNGAMGKAEGEGETSFGAPFKAAKRSYIFAMTSADGVNWSEPCDITPDILCADDSTCIETGIGNAVVTASGRIIVPLTDEKKAACIFSDDCGQTWQRNIRIPYLPVKGGVTFANAGGGEVLALGKKNAISYDNGISFGNFKSKLTPVASVTNAGKLVAIIQSKIGTVVLGGDFDYKKKKNKFKGITYSKEQSAVAGGLLPSISVASAGGKTLAVYVTPDRKQISFDTLNV
ncbi:MAG: exo-alpha-sialidase [Ruminococcaceae bacterium]|nr:exo-alpha-sialidase [Oscillospiraceae bacterium]